MKMDTSKEKEKEIEISENPELSSKGSGVGYSPEELYMGRWENIQTTAVPSGTGIKNENLPAFKAIGVYKYEVAMALAWTHTANTGNKVRLRKIKVKWLITGEKIGFLPVMELQGNDGSKMEI